MRVALVAGAWFLGAVLVFAVGEYLPGFASAIATAAGGAVAGAGLGVAGIYAVSVAFSAFGEADRSGVTPVDG